MLNNLFSNAARHAAESSPIRVAAERDGVHVAISVADEGRGVAPERLAHLFSKYSGAADEDRHSGIAGTGLGRRVRMTMTSFPMVLKGEDARASLALPDLAAPGLDLAVGAPAHVGVVPRAVESRGCDGT